MVLATVAGTAAHAAVQTNGPVSSFTVTTNASGNRSWLFNLAPEGQVEVTPYAPDVVRVRFHFGGLYAREEPAIARTFDQWPAFALSVTSPSATNLMLTTQQLRIEIALSNRFRVHFSDPSGYDLLRDYQIEYNAAYHQIDDAAGYVQVTWPGESSSVSNRPSGFKVKAIKVMPPDEAYFGGGDFAGPQNRRGRILQHWTQDTFQFGEYRNPKYTALPFFHGVRPASSNRPATVYGVFFNNPARPVIEFTSGLGDTYAFEAGDDQLDYFFFGGGSNHTMAAVLDRYSELTGRPALLPKWAYGYHQSRHSYDTQARVQEVATALRTNGFPCDALYLDIDTQNAPGGWRQQMTFNANFTNVAGMVSHVTNLGMRLVPIVEPCLLTNDPLYVEALTNLYFIKRNDLSTHVGTNFLGGVSWLDYSITNTACWWSGRLGAFLTNRFEAVWNDLNEPNENTLPLDALWYLDGRYGGGLVTNDTRKWHAVNKNTYSLLQARASEDALRRLVPDRRPFVITRAAWPGIAAHAVSWSGDNVSSWDHLRFNIRLGLGVMISGQPNFGHDIGGFVGNSSAELFTRWLQWGALTPYCRNHTLNGTSDQEPWVFGEPYTLWNRRAIELRYRLMPYLYSLAQQCSTSGVPMNAPVALHFTADTNTWSANEYDFMVGSHLLAAPVYVSNATTRAVRLPAGTDWFDWSDDDRFAGGTTVTQSASLGLLPLYARAGAIVPMGPVHLHAAAATSSWLEVHAWPGTNAFPLYEDDGLTTNHTAGQFAKTTLAIAGGPAALTFSIGARVGSYAVPDRSWIVVLHSLSNVTAVQVDGQAWPRAGCRVALTNSGWCYDVPSRLLSVRLPDNGAAHTLVTTSGQAPPAPPAWTSAYATMSAAGTFNGWNEGARNMRLVSNHVWAAVEDLTGQTNVQFKFVANDQWNVTNWGDNAQAVLSPPILDIADGSGGNILLTGSLTGVFTITFCETSRVYRVVSAATNDVDGDGAADGWERSFGLDPLNAADGLTDLDGDGLANADEARASGSPIAVDTDGDGSDDRAEFIAGTALANAASYFRVAAVGAATSGVIVSWSAVTGRLYDVEAATNLAAAFWVPVPGLSNLTGAGAVSFTDTNGFPYRHYRLKVQRE